MRFDKRIWHGSCGILFGIAFALKWVERLFNFDRLPPVFKYETPRPLRARDTHEGVCCR